SHSFVCKNVFLKPASFSNALTAGLEGRTYKIPVAHGEGNYYVDPETLRDLQENEQILLQYCNEEGETDGLSNSNGSLLNIAGVTNKTKNVFGMMPHPERAADENLGNVDGLFIFRSLLKNLVPA